MSNPTVALYGGFALAGGFLIGGIVIVLIGAWLFRRGTGIRELQDHTFEISGKDFKLNTTVSSVGAVVMLFGSVWGWFAYMSKPQYERTTPSINEKVTEGPPELARPWRGKLVIAKDGSKLKVDSVYGITSIDESKTETEALEKYLKGYAEYVRSTPNSAVVFSVGAKNDEKTKAWAAKFEESLTASGLTPREIVITSPEPTQWNQSAEPTISIIDTRPSTDSP